MSLQELWRVTLADLGRVRAPILLFTQPRGPRRRHAVGRLLHARATNATIEQTWLENSYHVATLDNDAEQIFDGSVSFVEAHTRTGAP